MKNWISNLDNKTICWLYFCVILFIAGLLLGGLVSCLSKNAPNVVDDRWGGSVPMKIYTVYDKDTGVYYAVTEKGGICVMETMSGETKLVDQGEPPVIHPNQGLGNAEES